MFDILNHTLNSENVHRLALDALMQLPIRALGGHVTPPDIYNVLLYAATWRTSITDSCDSLQDTPHHATVRKYLSEQLPELNTLERKLNLILQTFLPTGYTKHFRTIAIDLVDLPYHGTVKEKHEDEVRRSKPKEGTTRFFSYATAYMIRKGQRYTLAIYRVRKGETMDSVVEKILHRLKELGINATRFLLDRGFYSVRVINLLQKARKNFIMPMIRQGKTEEQGGPTGSRVFAAMKTSGWERYTMSNKHGETASFHVAVVCRNANGRRGKHGRETLLFATNCKLRKPDDVRERYRSRFGIESSYRQLNQARIKTSTRNPVLRLLFVWLALMLRNIWVWLHQEVVAKRGGGWRALDLGAMRFSRMLMWLNIEVTRRFHPILEIEVGACFESPF